MDNDKTPVLIISGPVGVGKTSVGDELSGLLESREIPHSFIDFDQLRYTYPRPDDDPWGNRLGLLNLRDLWGNAVAVGARNLVLSYVVEEQKFLSDVARAVPGAEITIVQLKARSETLQERVRRREVGAGLAACSGTCTDT